MNNFHSLKRVYYCSSRFRSFSKIVCRSTSGTGSIKTIKTGVEGNYSQKQTHLISLHKHGRLLSTMPLDESRAKARDEHLQEEVLNKNKKKSDATSNNGDSDVPKRRRLSEVPISEVLKAKHTLRWVEPTIERDCTVREAIAQSIDRKLSAMIVIESSKTNSPGSIQRGKVVGLTTSRDLLRVINDGFKHHVPDEEVFNRKVGDFMTPISKVIYARPEETIGICRSIIAKLGVKCLPILGNGRVEGLITARDMAEYGIDAADKGGKKHYLENQSERVGLSTNTSMAEPPAYIKAHLAMQQLPLYMNVGCAELPHPFNKYQTHEFCGITRRDYGPDEVLDNVDLSEDAYFVKKISLNCGPDVKPRDVIYAGVADGVGSWKEYGVDPRDFSDALMRECKNILREAEAEAKFDKKSGETDDDVLEELFTPAELMEKAMTRIKADNIIGSSTACVAVFDGIRHQVHFSNIGDSGIIVLRHIDSEVAGVLKRDKSSPRTERISDLRVAFVSQQQLRSFNHPYQLGWTGEEVVGEETSFRNPAEACTSSIHIRRGDIVIMATDGLFDNVELEDITKIAYEWEQRHGFIVGGDIASREKRWKRGTSMTKKSSETIDELAKLLVDKARENSLDSTIDSPFAILAKENDIMWSGGMPDDCTVIAMHVVGEPAITTAEK